MEENNTTKEPEQREERVNKIWKYLFWIALILVIILFISGKEFELKNQLVYLTIFGVVVAGIWKYLFKEKKYTHFEQLKTLKKRN